MTTDIASEGLPNLAALRRELQHMRVQIIMVAQAEKKRAKARAAVRWTNAQESLVKRNPAMSSEKLSRLVSTVGPERSAKAVKSKRREYQRSKSLDQDRRERSWGEPALGDVYSQSERFRVVLLTEMLAEVRAR